MLFVKLVFIILFDPVLGLHSSRIYDQLQGCLDGNKTYVINVHSHIQNEVRDAIVSLAAKLPLSSLIDGIQGSSGEKASVIATRSYLGTIIEELNKDLEKFNVQLNLIFENLEIDQISANGAYDPSCELESPVKERTANSYASFLSKLNNTIGIHLMLFGCVYRNPEYDLIHVMSNSNCGRVLGVMWDGSVNTKTLIKSAILEGLTGAKDAYANGYLTVKDKNILCGYFEKCVGMTPTIHGQLLNFKKVIKYTDDGLEDNLK